jgi:hypothetical protein
MPYSGKIAPHLVKITSESRSVVDAMNRVKKIKDKNNKKKIKKK